MSDKIRKIAFVSHRYGKDIEGGSESYTRHMAEGLAEIFKDKAKITVLTSCAKDFKTWANYYPEGEEEINDVTVIRFPVTKGRSRLKQRGGQILMRNLDIKNRTVEENRVLGRGPVTPALIEYIKEHKDEYDVFIFVTYMFYQAYFGSKEVYDKAVFIPTAHDEEPIYMDIYKEMFNRVNKIIYLTDEEKAFVERTFGNSSVKNKVIGMDIEVDKAADENLFRNRYKDFLKNDPYVIYAGRLEKDKGVDELITYFSRYKAEETATNAAINAARKADGRSALKLVLLGRGSLEIPDRDDILAPGFVDEDIKYSAFKGAKVICLPSAFESFSISLLEGMAYGNPALVNGKSEVLKGHIEKSGGGFAYNDYESFKSALDELMKESGEKADTEGKAAKNGEFGMKAKEYVEKKYSRSSILKEFYEFIL